MNQEMIDYFETLSAEEIRQQTPGKWDDMSLLDIYVFFEDEGDMERATAVLTLLLSSPENNYQMVDYASLYQDQSNNYRQAGDLDSAAYWAVAGMAYCAQHDIEIDGLRDFERTFAEIQIAQGNVDAGLKLYARLLQLNPLDLKTHLHLGGVLADAGLRDLAVAGVERGLELAEKDDPEEMLEPLVTQYEELIESEETAVAPAPAVRSDALAQFYLALTELDEEGPYLYSFPVTELFKQDDSLDKNVQSALLAQADILIPELLTLAFDEDYWGEPVNSHTLFLLRQIQATHPALGALTHWLEQATESDWYTHLSTETGKIGWVPIPELKAIATDATLDTFVRSSAAETLARQMQGFPDLRPELIAYFRTLLTRPEAYEAGEELFIGLLITSITDAYAQELYPEIKQVFDEDRIDPTITSLSSIHERWEMPSLPEPERREDGLYVLLDCKKCKRSRRYFVQHVTVDLTTLIDQEDGQPFPYDPYVMDRAIVCPKCGAVDQYKTPPLTALYLSLGDDMENTMVARMLGEDVESTPNPRVSPVRLQAFGQYMHPLAAYDRYKRILLSKPKDPELHWRMGSVLRTIWRDEDALAVYQKTSSLDPENPLPYYSLACVEHDLGYHEKAKEHYEKCIRLISPVEMLEDEESMALSMNAVAGLKALKKGLPSPYAQAYRQPPEEEDEQQDGRFATQTQKKKRR